MWTSNIRASLLAQPMSTDLVMHAEKCGVHLPGEDVADGDAAVVEEGVHCQ